MNRFIKQNLYLWEIVFLLIIGLIPLLWYKEGYIALGHDMGFPLAPIDYFQDRLFSWTERVGSFGSNQTESLAGIFIHGLEALVASLGLSLVATQKIVFIFWFTLPGIAMYTLLRSLHPEKEDSIIRLSGSLFYMMNHYLLQGWMIAERTKFMIVAAMPLVVLLIINVVYKKQSALKNSILLSIVMFLLNGGAGIPLLGGLAVAAFITLIIMFFSSSESFYPKIKRTSAFILLSLTFIFILNLYWVYPYLESFSQNFTVRANASGGGEGAANWSAEISKYASFINIIKMQGIPDWYNNPDHPYSNYFLNNFLLIFLGIVFPLIGFMGLAKKETESKTSRVYKINFLLILLIGIPLTAGSHPPTGVLYDFALKYVPGFLIFRTPFLKFGMVIWFAYAYFIALGLKNTADFFYPKIFKTWSNISKQTVYSAIFVAFVLLLSIYNYPFLTGSFFDWSAKYSTRIKVPDYIFEAKEEIDSKKFSTRILLMPDLDERRKTDSYNWKYYSLSNIPSILTRKPTVINDVILQGDEGALVTGIYDQLRTEGRSDLLNFVGVDQIIIRDDFSSPEDMEYIHTAYNSILADGKQFRLNKQIGDWGFWNIRQDKVKPLIYSPQTLSNLIIDPEHLSTALSFSDRPSLGDAFILNNISDPQQVDPEKISQYIVEGKCIDCDLQQTTDPLLAKPSRILPGNKLYTLVKFFEDWRYSKIVDPAQRIDFNLGIMAKNAASVDLLIRDVKNTDIIKEIITIWGRSMKEITKNYNEMQMDDRRLKSEERIYRYLWFFILKSQQWKIAAASSENISQLNLFESAVRSYIEKMHLSPPKVDVVDAVSIGRYEVNIPKKGTYKFGVYTVANNSQEQKEEDKENSLKSSIVIDGKSVDLIRVNTDSSWSQTQNLSLDAKTYTIVLPQFTQKTIVYPDFEVKALAAQSQCKDIKVENVDSRKKYQVYFNYKNPSGNPLNVKIVEENTRFGKSAIQKAQINSNEISGEVPFSKNEFWYYPSKLTKTAMIRFCLDGYYFAGTLISIDNFRINEIEPDAQVFAYSVDSYTAAPIPNVEFKALNQTKYLIRTDSSPSNFMLIFNARVDGNWKLREVDLDKSSKYFQGEKKEYLDGKVIEYQRGEGHIISDLVFPNDKSREIVSNGLVANAVANTWNIELKNDQRINDKKVFLLEYDVQNNVYIAAVLSISVFISLLILYFVLSRYE